MPFEFTTPFPQTDPNCIAKFTRSFEHIDWIDGESVVQAEQTPTEDGFNVRFHRIIDDLDELAADARRSLECTAAMRNSLFSIINEVEAELSRIGTPVEGWRDATMLNGWSGELPPFSLLPFPLPISARPGFFRDASGVVHLRGVAFGGPVPAFDNGQTSLMFQLPVGYRPSIGLMLPVMADNQTICRLDVFLTGEVQLRSAYTRYVSLDGVSFAP